VVVIASNAEFEGTDKVGCCGGKDQRKGHGAGPFEAACLDHVILH